MMRVANLAALVLAASSVALAQSSLTITNATASRMEDGPPLGALRLVPGEVVYFSFTASGYSKSAEGRVEMTGHAQVFDPAGVPIAPKDDLPVITNLGENDKNWIPKFRTAVSLPPLCQPGAYRIRFDAVDEQTHQSASGEATFDVQAKFVAPSSTLVIRELNFFRNQEDTTPLITASYRAGDTVWVKFFIIGYKYGEQNAVDASYDVELLGPDGATILKQEDAAMEKSTAYYPQPYVPAVFNLSLKPTMTRSTYTLIVTAHDAVGKQTATAQSKFVVN